ncbi:OTU-like cysteine protease [Diplonema papillatum]|nr:OTU-like cysteine protease [Diplonema papillatum]KAJ9437897.1 OTU-like cysteine protease [Diplonema papillatum]
MSKVDLTRSQKLDIVSREGLERKDASHWNACSVCYLNQGNPSRNKLCHPCWMLVDPARALPTPESRKVHTDQLLAEKVLLARLKQEVNAFNSGTSTIEDWREHSVSAKNVSPLVRMGSRVSVSKGRSRDPAAEVALARTRWTCGVCTLDNAVEDKKCVVCDSPQPEDLGPVEIAWECAECGTPDGDVHGKKCKSCGSWRAWSCPQCTLQNLCSNELCTACETRWDPTVEPAASAEQSFMNGLTDEQKLAIQKDIDEQVNRNKCLEDGRGRLDARLRKLRSSEQIMLDDGNCQFRSLSFQLWRTQQYHSHLRAVVVDRMRSHRSDFDMYFTTTEEFEAYVNRMACTTTWGDELTLRAASDALGITIHIATSENGRWILSYEPLSDPSDVGFPINEGEAPHHFFLSYQAPVHYNSIIPEEDTNSHFLFLVDSIDCMLVEQRVHSDELHRLEDQCGKEMRDNSALAKGVDQAAKKIEDMIAELRRYPSDEAQERVKAFTAQVHQLRTGAGPPSRCNSVTVTPRRVPLQIRTGTSPSSSSPDARLPPSFTLAHQPPAHEAAAAAQKSVDAAFGALSQSTDINAPPPFSRKPSALESTVGSLRESCLKTANRSFRTARQTVTYDDGRKARPTTPRNRGPLSPLAESRAGKTSEPAKTDTSAGADPASPVAEAEYSPLSPPDELAAGSPRAACVERSPFAAAAAAAVDNPAPAAEEAAAAAVLAGVRRAEELLQEQENLETEEYGDDEATELDQTVDETGLGATTSDSAPPASPPKPRPLTPRGKLPPEKQAPAAAAGRKRDSFKRTGGSGRPLCESTRALTRSSTGRKQQSQAQAHSQQQLGSSNRLSKTDSHKASGSGGSGTRLKQAAPPPAGETPLKKHGSGSDASAVRAPRVAEPYKRKSTEPVQPGGDVPANPPPPSTPQAFHLKLSKARPAAKSVPVIAGVRQSVAAKKPATTPVTTPRKKGGLAQEQVDGSEPRPPGASAHSTSMQNLHLHEKRPGQGLVKSSSFGATRGVRSRTPNASALVPAAANKPTKASVAKLVSKAEPLPRTSSMPSATSPVKRPGAGSPSPFEAKDPPPRSGSFTSPVTPPDENAAIGAASPPASRGGAGFASGKARPREAGAAASPAAGVGTFGSGGGLRSPRMSPRGVAAGGGRLSPRLDPSSPVDPAPAYRGLYVSPLVKREGVKSHSPPATARSRVRVSPLDDQAGADDQQRAAANGNNGGGKKAHSATQASPVLVPIRAAAGHSGGFGAPGSPKTAARRDPRSPGTPRTTPGSPNGDPIKPRRNSAATPSHVSSDSSQPRPLSPDRGAHRMGSLYLESPGAGPRAKGGPMMSYHSPIGNFKPGVLAAMAQEREEREREWEEFERRKRSSAAPAAPGAAAVSPAREKQRQQTDPPLQQPPLRTVPKSRGLVGGSPCVTVEPCQAPGKRFSLDNTPGSDALHPTDSYNRSSSFPITPTGSFLGNTQPARHRSGSLSLAQARSGDLSISLQTKGSGLSSVPVPQSSSVAVAIQRLGEEHKAGPDAWRARVKQQQQQQQQPPAKLGDSNKSSNWSDVCMAAVIRTTTEELQRLPPRLPDSDGSGSDEGRASPPGGSFASRPGESVKTGAEKPDKPVRVTVADVVATYLSTGHTRLRQQTPLWSKKSPRDEAILGSRIPPPLRQLRRKQAQRSPRDEPPATALNGNQHCASVQGTAGVKPQRKGRSSSKPARHTPNLSSSTSRCLPIGLSARSSSLGNPRTHIRSSSKPLRQATRQPAAHAKRTCPSPSARLSSSIVNKHLTSPFAASTPVLMRTRDRNELRR